MKRMFACAALLMLSCGFALGQAQYQVLYSFGPFGSNDGAFPNAGLVSDSAGNLYGTSYLGGPIAGGDNGCLFGCGTVFQLSPQQDGSWTNTILHTFCSTGNPTTCPDGARPASGLVRGKNGKLYGTTLWGGPHGAGTVFELAPPSAPDSPWTETVLWSFCSTSSCPDGSSPFTKLTSDAKDNLYGTTEGGGAYGHGTVFAVTPVSGSSWKETVLYAFKGAPDDGQEPLAGVTFDASGNLYGTTRYGGGTGCGSDNGCGAVFQLSPNSDGTWTENVIARGAYEQVYFSSDLSFDNDGNLYGTSYGVANNSLGGVFKLIRATGWKPATFAFEGANGALPDAGVLLEKGALYGTTSAGGAQSEGTIFLMTGKTETVLYSFCSQPNCADGASAGPGGVLLSDHSGHLYGTTVEGGANNNGVVFEIIP